MMQPSTTMMKIVTFLSYSVIDELHHFRNHQETLKPSSLPGIAATFCELIFMSEGNTEK